MKITTGIKTALTVSFCAAAVCLMSGCGRKPAERTWLVMGTFAEVSTGEARIDEARETATKTFAELDSTWSYFRPDSDVSRINAASGAVTEVSEPTALLISDSVRYASLTGGCFDPTVGPLVDLWGINSGGEFTVPGEDAVLEALQKCGWQKVRLEGRSAQFLDPGLHLDPGGIAKGLAVDICSEKLTAKGFNDFMVNLGGNMRCFGAGRNGQTWTVGVRNPFEKRSVLGIIHLTDGMSVATSGNYERFAEKDGRRYAHIIDPRSGKPVEGMAGVTVVAASAVEADALSTALFVAGIEEGTAILKQFPSADALFIPDRKPIEVHVTGGLVERFKPEAGLKVFEITPQQAVPRP